MIALLCQGSYYLGQAFTALVGDLQGKAQTGQVHVWHALRRNSPDFLALQQFTVLSLLQSSQQSGQCLLQTSAHEVSSFLSPMQMGSNVCHNKAQPVVYMTSQLDKTFQRTEHGQLLDSCQ